MREKTCIAISRKFMKDINIMTLDNDRHAEVFNYISYFISRYYDEDLTISLENVNYLVIRFDKKYIICSCRLISVTLGKLLEAVVDESCLQRNIDKAKYIESVLVNKSYIKLFSSNLADTLVISDTRDTLVSEYIAYLEDNEIDRLKLIIETCDTNISVLIENYFSKFEKPFRLSSIAQITRYKGGLFLVTEDDTIFNLSTGKEEINTEIYREVLAKYNIFS